jgi:hypothetical protein
MVWKPGDHWDQAEEVAEFWVWGNQLFLQDDLAVTSDDLTLYYWAYWPEVEYTVSGSDISVQQEQILTPKWAELALVHLTVATCFAPHEIFASDINEYKIKVEAGTPLHNPRAEAMMFHLNWWHVIMDKYPPARITEVA